MRFKELFWNREDERLHVIWRLIVFFGLYVGMRLFDRHVLAQYGMELILDVKMQLFLAIMIGSWMDKRKIEDFGFKFNL